MIDKLRAWLDAALPQVPPNSANGKALYYLNEQRPKLVRYLEDASATPLSASSPW